MAVPRLPVKVKEPRYWAWEFPIAILVVVGTLVVTIGLPAILHSSSAWATLVFGLIEGLVAIGIFALARLNVIRAVAAAMFAAGAIAFIAGLQGVY